MTHRIRPFHAFAIFIAFAAGHFLSYALRSVNATLAPHLVRDLSLTPADLGWLSSAYYVSFAIMQYPLGIWLDRYGERIVESLLLLIAAAGAFLIATGETLTTLSWGRILVGIGVSACLMAPFTYFRRNFAPERQSQLSLMLLVLGTSGAVSSTWPAAALAQALGWRSVFSLVAALLLLVAVAIFFIVPRREKTASAPAVPQPDATQQQTHTTEDAHTAGSGAISTTPSLLRHPAIIRVMPLFLIGQGGVIALQTLWAGPWMTQVLGMSDNQMARIMFLLMLAIMLAYVVMSFVSPRLQQRGISMQRIAYIGHIISVTTVVSIALFPTPGAWWLWIVLSLTFPALSLMQPGVSILFPRAMAGRVLTLCNLFMFGGAFLVQWGIGLLIDGFHILGLPYERAYPSTLLILATLHALSIVWLRIKGGQR